MSDVAFLHFTVWFLAGSSIIIIYSIIQETKKDIVKEILDAFEDEDEDEDEWKKG